MLSIEKENENQSYMLKITYRGNKRIKEVSNSVLTWIAERTWHKENQFIVFNLCGFVYGHKKTQKSYKKKNTHTHIQIY